MSGETESQVSGWTTDTLRVLMDERQRHNDAFQVERDRRYAEVNIEKEKALKIKETADLAALSLAREIQDYKDEKANNLRTQIEAERGDYATKSDLIGAVEKLEAIIKPLTEFVFAARGGSSGVQAFKNNQIAYAMVIAAFLGAVLYFLATHVH